MKKTTLKGTLRSQKNKLVFLIICLFLNVGLNAQTITINVETAGTLSSLIASSKKYLITNLKLTGNLNGTDITYIRDMAGISINRNETEGKLSLLDLSDANIVSGGNYYYWLTSKPYSAYYSENNKIGAYMFNGCTKLVSITIPNNVTSIGNYAFYGCTSLTSLTIPESVTSIGNIVFQGCPKLNKFIVPNENVNYSTIDDVLFNKDATTLISYPNAKGSTYTIPNSVTSIGDYAFNECTNLASIAIPNSVTSIGDQALYGCASLTSITIPNSVTSIKDYAFCGCTSLASVNIPNSVTSIGNRAFLRCTSLASITIPNNVTSIGDYAFYECTSLASITIPNSVTSIGNYAFYGCTSLASATIPNNATFIGYEMFYGCTGLNEIIASSENANYSAIDGVLFNKNGSTLILYPNAKGSTYSIPNNVTSIDNNAFYKCTNLVSVIIPNSVTSLGYSAFEECTSLVSVTIPNSLTSIGAAAFQRCTKLAEIHCKKVTPIALSSSNISCFDGVDKSTCKLYVPKGSYSFYWIAPIWGDFINIIEEDDTDGINTIISDALSISSSSEGININSDKAIEISLYNISGQCVYKGTISGEATIPVENGLYIAKVGDKTFKVQK